MRSRFIVALVMLCVIVHNCLQAALQVGRIIAPCIKNLLIKFNTFGKTDQERAWRFGHQIIILFMANEVASPRCR
jgi:hypothetical protein